MPKKIIVLLAAALCITVFEAHAGLHNVRDLWVEAFPSGNRGNKDTTGILKKWQEIVVKFKSGDTLLMQPLNFSGQDKWLPPAAGFDLSDAPNNMVIIGTSYFADSSSRSGKPVPNVAFRKGNSGHKILFVPISVGKPGGLKNSFVFENGGGIFGGPFDDVTIVNKNMQTSSTMFNIQDFKNSRLIYWASQKANSQLSPVKQVKLSGDFSNSVMVNSVQTNYCNTDTSVLLDNVKGLTLLGGDNERAAGPSWFLRNCTDVRIVAMRVFSSQGQCQGKHSPVSIGISGGANNKLVYSSDIGLSSLSVMVQNSQNLMHWGGSWGRGFHWDPASEASGLKVFYSPNVFGDADIDKQPEPVNVDKEIIFSYKGENLLTGDSKRIKVPVPPSIPSTKTNWSLDVEMPAISGFGKALLDAGADPTGSSPSDAAFEAVLSNPALGKNIDLPAGVFLITKSISPHSIRGVSREKSVIKMSNSSQSVIVRKSNGEYFNFTIDGGHIGVVDTGYYAGTVLTNVTIKNSAFAGYKGAGSAIYDGQAHEFDQKRFFNVHFENTGDYGIQVNAVMTDKNHFYKCVFTGQKKAGISYPRTQMFAGAITDCVFKDIDGSAIELHHSETFHTHPNGYTPHCSTIDGCTFINCGNAERPVIDWSWMESGSISNSTIQIKGKAWKYGFLGAAQYMYNVTMDVDMSQMAAGGAAIALRSPRVAKNSRPTGNILKAVNANGPVAFINDMDETSNMSMKKVYPQWSGGDWAYPHLFYDCKFSNKDYSLATGKKMVLVNTEYAGQIKAEVELSPMDDEDPPVSLVKRVQPTLSNPLPRATHDVLGRPSRKQNGSAFGEVLFP